MGAPAALMRFSIVCARSSKRHHLRPELHVETARPGAARKRHPTGGAGRSSNARSHVRFLRAQPRRLTACWLSPPPRHSEPSGQSRVLDAVVGAAATRVRRVWRCGGGPARAQSRARGKYCLGRAVASVSSASALQGPCWASGATPAATASLLGAAPSCRTSAATSACATVHRTRRTSMGGVEPPPCAMRNSGGVSHHTVLENQVC